MGLLLSLASLVACILVASAASGMLFLLPRTLLLTELGGRGVASEEDSDVEPCATDMLSFASCAADGGALVRHALLYQLEVVVVVVGDCFVVASFVAGVSTAAAELLPSRC